MKTLLFGTLVVLGIAAAPLTASADDRWRDDNPGSDVDPYARDGRYPYAGDVGPDGTYRHDGYDNDGRDGRRFDRFDRYRAPRYVWVRGYWDGRARMWVPGHWEMRRHRPWYGKWYHARRWDSPRGWYRY